MKTQRISGTKSTQRIKPQVWNVARTVTAQSGQGVPSLLSSLITAVRWGTEDEYLFAVANYPKSKVP